MGLFDKLKKVLFDEDEVEVTVENDELPTKPSKKPDKNQGFKNYHQDEEDTIKEVVVPKEEEPVVEEPVKPAFPEPTPEPPRRSVFPVDDFDTVPQEEFGYRSHRYNEQPIAEPTPIMERPRIVEEEKPKEEPNRDRYRIEPVKPKVHETKDYHKYLQEDTSTKLSKKPFKVTPVISPVYGILDENYIPSEVVNKADFNPSGRDGNKKKKKDDKKTSLKEDLVELNSTINEMINETEEAKVVEEEKVVAEVTVEEPTIEVPVVEETKEEVIETPVEEVVPEVEEESEPDIEDAFEPTEEIHTIEAQEEETPEEEEEEPEATEPTISLDELIKNNSSNNEDESEEDENLNNTLETDLYNLINSMYKDDDDEEEQ